MGKINIAIDGHSSCGKSTIAKALAKKINYLYVDSGAMYRSITLYALRHDLMDNKKLNEADLLNKLAKIHIRFEMVNGIQHTFLNDEDVELEIRSPKISQYVSQVAKIPEVRKYLVKQQQKLGRNKGVVMDGRDIGTVVFPSAEIKFYITADVDVRAKRRYNEMMENGFNDVSLADIKANIEERDFLDSHRKVSPLMKANDAIVLDTSNISEEEQLDFTFNEVQKILRK
jgi:cytidylate kinase